MNFAKWLLISIYWWTQKQWLSTRKVCVVATKWYKITLSDNILCCQATEIIMSAISDQYQDLIFKVESIHHLTHSAEFDMIINAATLLLSERCEWTNPLPNWRTGRTSLSQGELIYGFAGCWLLIADLPFDILLLAPRFKLQFWLFVVRCYVNFCC